jgi:ATP-dependent Zn protease
VNHNNTPIKNLYLGGYVKSFIKLVCACYSILFLSIASACSESDELDTDQLIVSQVSFNFSQNDGYNFITTLGTIKNLSNAKAEDLVVEVKYFNADKKLIDIVTQSLYGIEIPKGQEVSIRVRDVADRLKKDYLSNSVRIISANGRIVKHNPPPEKRSNWENIFISWMPMILLISVWIYLVKRQNKKGPVARSVELVEQQNQILTRQIEVLERISIAVEKFTKE